jgi:hypothetical protein
MKSICNVHATSLDQLVEVRSCRVAQLRYTVLVKYFVKRVSYIDSHLSKLYTTVPNVQHKTTARSFCVCCQRVTGILYRNMSQPSVKMVVMIYLNKLNSLSKNFRQPRIAYNNSLPCQALMSNTSKYISIIIVINIMY